MAKASVTGTRYCECLSIAGGLRDCPAHGAFATASARRDYEGEIEQLRDALWECVKLSGADVSDGPPRPGTADWPQIAELAVREVGQLRADYDEALEDG